MIEAKEVKETWRDIPNYEGYYQVSDLGRVRSLDRQVTYSNGREQFYRGRVIEGSVHKGYKETYLSKDNIGKTYKFSQLVAMAFLEHKPNGMGLVVDHINGDKSDDRVENLQIVTHRANSSTCFRSNKESFSSEYTGVHWGRSNSRWVAEIHFKGNDVKLGYFTDELEASIAYQKALHRIEIGSFNPDDHKPKFTSQYDGVCFYKPTNKWMAQISVKGKQRNLGYYITELEAYQAYQNKLNELNNTNKV